MMPRQSRPVLSSVDDMSVLWAINVAHAQGSMAMTGGNTTRANPVSEVVYDFRFGEQHGAARLFEPNDRLAYARLQQMRLTDPMTPSANHGIARTEADGLLLGGDCLL